MRRTLPFQNAVIQFSFKLDGAKMTTLSINDAKEHLARVLINPAGLTLRVPVVFPPAEFQGAARGASGHFSESVSLWRRIED